ncbi:hypothetical protein AUT07_00515 [Candidatus Arsenophonus lipoptenae]|uniref:Endonuclease/exonuclease/phosphatase domain-containing protein n=1 Tax=Candidatus Arsenophonus lipoptenae TaxID=634113 RepID=A0A0X9VVR2_9GAMM|nr:endonuclease/exonuclease/phosphatase family protein [Candidatus Arsenophonus lipoptenae]AMA65073.1 hypothetical protein AUT07_00515 [Candidatus Arsenophonus lipoptenae]
MVKKNYFLRKFIDHAIKTNGFISRSDNNLPIIMPQSLESEGLRIISWNIYKQQRQNWFSVLNKLVIDKHLILLQEAQPSPQLIKFIISQNLIVDQAPAIVLPQYTSGVMTLSRSHSIYCCSLREQEPLIRLPKSTLITVYSLYNRRNLMIINIHAINFSFGLNIYSRQLHNIEKYIKRHEGPIIFAGDFNTWNRQRTNILKHFTFSLGMKEVNFDIDVRTIIFGYPIDHVFYRNLILLDAEVIKTKSSDHNPISVKFSVK